MAHAARNPNIPDRDGVSPSCVATPSGSWALALDFLAERLPALSRDAWAERMDQGWVWNDAAQALGADAPFCPHTRVYYWRHSPHEPKLPWPAQVLYQDAHLVVADKPAFMPVTPTGPFVQSSLLVQLKRELGLPALSPIHRIDRDTAGLVMFAVQANERAAYQALFRDRLVHKRYEAIAPAADLAELAARSIGLGTWSTLGRRMTEAEAPSPTPPVPATDFDARAPAPMSQGAKREPDEHVVQQDDQAWCYRSRLASHAHFFTMHEVGGEANCETHVQRLQLDSSGRWARYALVPHTGRRHQLRAHMSALGLPLRHDPYYPQVSRKAEDTDDWQHPLQLLARQLSFVDPITSETRLFDSRFRLDWPPTAP